MCPRQVGWSQTAAMRSANNDANKSTKGLKLSEKRKKVAEKKKSKKTNARSSSSRAEPSQDQIKRLLVHYQAGRLEEAEVLATSLTQQFPSHPFGWKVLGLVLQQTGRLAESLAHMQTAVELSLQDAEAHNNLGITLSKLGRLDDSEASYRRAIALRPDFAEAHNNLGNALKDSTEVTEAEACYERAILLAPDYAEAHSNLANLYQSLGRLREAERSYGRAFELNPRLPGLLAGIASLTQFHVLNSKPLEPIAKVQGEISEIALTEQFPNNITDDAAIAIYDQLLTVVDEVNLILTTDRSQIYRRNSVSLNCERHKAIFEEFNVIPEFCFGCYKVEVTPRTFLELLKLNMIFDQIELPSNNTRKCMVETRANIGGFYKGLVYSLSAGEAFDIAELISRTILQRLGIELSIQVKRGCSEYALSFPAYKHVDKSGTQLLDYNQDWKSSEVEFDSRRKITASVSNVSLQGANLLDLLIIRRWISYAAGLGDSSVTPLHYRQMSDDKLYKLAQRRGRKYQFESSAGQTAPDSHL